MRFPILVLVLLPPLAAAAQPRITPPPREVAWTEERMPLDGAAITAASEEARQIGRLLRDEALRLHRARLNPGAPGRGPVIRLLLTDTPAGKAAVAKLAPGKWPAGRNPDQAYVLETGSRGATIAAASPAGLLYGVNTLLQLVSEGGEIHGARIFDYPQLGFRGLHICIFPNTELAAVRQAMLLAARYKYSAVVLEPWASLQSRKRPESAYEHAYSPEQIRPLVELGRALRMEMIPMLNSWGHASGMRSRSGEHVVLDRFPRFKPLYEPDGWSFCLANPDIYGHLFDRYDELLDLFGPVQYFHAGMDEAWGHLGLTESAACRGPDPRRTLIGHLRKIHEYFARRNVRVIMWHDMFIQRNHPQLGRLSPANSIPPIDSHLALDALPKEVIIDAWNYDEAGEWPVPRYFQEKGYPVLVSPWKKKSNTLSLVNTAKRLDLLGLLATTWDSLDVALPQVAEAGVLSWTAPGYRLDVPFDHWLAEIRKLPVCDLPQHERTLKN